MLGDDGVVEALEKDCFDGRGEQVVEERLGVGGELVDVVEPCLRVFLGELGGVARTASELREELAGAGRPAGSA